MLCAVSYSSRIDRDIPQVLYLLGKPGDGLNISLGDLGPRQTLNPPINR